MSDKIKIRRGDLVDLPNLDTGELGFATDADNLYIGSDAGNVLINPIKEGVDGYILDGYLSPTVDNVHGLGTADLRWKNVVVGPGSLHLVSRSGEVAGAREWSIGIGADGNLTMSESGVSMMEVSSTTGLVLSGDTTVVGALSILESTAPAAEDGYGKLYVQEDGNLYYKNFTGTQTNLLAAAGVDHGALLGLSDDDHSHYLLTDGTRTITGGLRALSGSAGSPSYSFASDTNTGVYNSGSGVSLSTGGIEGFRITDGITSVTLDAYGDIRVQGSNRVILPSSNDVNMPTLAFGDGDTGFYETADDQVSFASNGIEAIKFIGSSTLQMNSTNGAALIREAPSATNPVYVFGNDSDTGIGTAAADQLSLIAGGVEGVRVTELGGLITTNISGVLGLMEGAAPSAVDGYGQLYVQGDGYLYYKDFVGTQTNITLGTQASILDYQTTEDLTFTIDPISGSDPASPIFLKTQYAINARGSFETIAACIDSIPTVIKNTIILNITSDVNLSPLANGEEPYFGDFKRFVFEQRDDWGNTFGTGYIQIQSSDDMSRVSGASGTFAVTSGTSTTVTLSSDPSFSVDVYRTDFLRVVSGTGAGQIKPIRHNDGTLFSTAGIFSPVLDGTSVVEIVEPPVTISETNFGFTGLDGNQQNNSIYNSFRGYVRFNQLTLDISTFTISGMHLEFLQCHIIGALDLADTVAGFAGVIRSVGTTTMWGGQILQQDSASSDGLLFIDSGLRLREGYSSTNTITINGEHMWFDGITGHAISTETARPIQTFIRAGQSGSHTRATAVSGYGFVIGQNTSVFVPVNYTTADDPMVGTSGDTWIYGVGAKTWADLHAVSATPSSVGVTLLKAIEGLDGAVLSTKS